MIKKLILIPLLSIMIGTQASDSIFTKPVQFSFGSKLESVKHDIDKLCSSIEVRNIVPITAVLAKNSQAQINCSGFMYGGKEREVELVFLDNQLDLVWILIPQVEKQKFISNFKAIFGEPSMTINYGAIFLQANAAIRNEPSEVLFASNRQVKVMVNILKKKQEQISKQ